MRLGKLPSRVQEKQVPYRGGHTLNSPLKILCFLFGKAGRWYSGHFFFQKRSMALWCDNKSIYDIAFKIVLLFFFLLGWSHERDVRAALAQNRITSFGSMSKFLSSAETCQKENHLKKKTRWRKEKTKSINSGRFKKGKRKTCSLPSSWINGR